MVRSHWVQLGGICQCVMICWHILKWLMFTKGSVLNFHSCKCFHLLSDDKVDWRSLLRIRWKNFLLGIKGVGSQKQRTASWSCSAIRANTCYFTSNAGTEWDFSHVCKKQFHLSVSRQNLEALGIQMFYSDLFRQGKFQLFLSLYIKCILILLNCIASGIWASIK